VTIRENQVWRSKREKGETKRRQSPRANKKRKKNTKEKAQTSLKAKLFNERREASRQRETKRVLLLISTDEKTGELSNMVEEKRSEKERGCFERMGVLHTGKEKGELERKIEIVESRWGRGGLQ